MTFAVDFWLDVAPVIVSLILLGVGVVAVICLVLLVQLAGDQRRALAERRARAALREEERVEREARRHARPHGSVRAVTPLVIERPVMGYPLPPAGPGVLDPGSWG